MVSFELTEQTAGLGEISSHGFVLRGEFVADLVNDQLRVATDQQPFGTCVLGETKACQKCLVLGFVVGSSKLESDCVFDRGVIWCFEDEASTAALPIGGVIHI